MRAYDVNKKDEENLLTQAHHYVNSGNSVRAIEIFENLLNMYRRNEDKENEAYIALMLSNLYPEVGDFEKAISYVNTSMKFYQENEKAFEVASCYLCLGHIYDDLGEYGKAIESLVEALRIYRDDHFMAVTYNGLGEIYIRLGDLEKAISCLNNSLKFYQKYGKETEVVICYLNLGQAYGNLAVINKEPAHIEKAVEYYKKALNINKGRNELLEANSNLSLGLAYLYLDEREKAIESFNKSLLLYGKLNNFLGITKCYGSLGNYYHYIGDFNEAVKFYEKSIIMANEIGDINTERVNYFYLSQLFFDINPEIAYSYCKHSLDLSEQIAGGLVGEENKLSFQIRVSDAYRYLILLCLRMKKNNEAYEYSESSRSRVFLDMLSTTEVKPTIKLSNEMQLLLNEEERLLAALRLIQTRHLTQYRVRVEPGIHENIRKRLNQIYDEIERFDPEYVYMRRGRPLSLDQLQETLAQQKRDVVLIEYYTTPEETYIFLVSSRNKELHVNTVPVSEDKLRQYYENYRREVVNHPRYGDIGESWLALGDYLIEPISEYLTEDDLVYFVPHGILHYLPLHALSLNGEPLIVNHPVAYSPSASLIRFCQNKGSGKLETCASLGVVFEEEAEEVAKLFDIEPFSPQITKDEVKEFCRDKDVIHFSCHGRFDDLDPLSSGLKLHGGVLTAREIFGMRLDSELVTLSACQTGLNERSPGDELIGLTRAFLYAGSPSVVVSLWSVDARSTQELMLEFYRLLRDGHSIAEALQMAQRRMMEKEEYSHPYYWAPFILVGDRR